MSRGLGTRRPSKPAPKFSARGVQAQPAPRTTFLSPRGRRAGVFGHLFELLGHRCRPGGCRGPEPRSRRAALDSRGRGTCQRRVPRCPPAPAPTPWSPRRPRATDHQRSRVCRAPPSPSPDTTSRAPAPLVRRQGHRTRSSSGNSAHPAAPSPAVLGRFLSPRPPTSGGSPGFRAPL